MKANEKILKYLTDELSAKEKSQFEFDLENNKELKKQFEKCLTQLEELKNSKNLEFNETYFTNLIPRVLERIERNKQKTWMPKLAFTLPIIAIIVFFVFYSKSSDDYAKFVTELPDSAQQAIVSLIEKENPGLQDDYLKDIKTKEIIETEISNKIDIDDLNLNLKLNYTDDYEIINSLSQEEVDGIYNSMMRKKIL